MAILKIPALPLFNKRSLVELPNENQCYWTGEEKRASVRNNEHLMWKYVPKVEHRVSKANCLQIVLHAHWWPLRQ